MKKEKAVKKAKARKQQAGARTLELEAALQMAKAQLIDPEIQAEQVDMQPADGYVNPYRELGYMAPMAYSPGNMISGYNFGQMVNPEA
jgi:hypothetical protein